MEEKVIAALATNLLTRLEFRKLKILGK